MLRNSKAAPVWQLTFSILLFSILIVSCDDPGSVGSSYVPESEVRIDTITLATLQTESLDPYTGQLTFSPVGAFNDPLFGEISSHALFKPSIIEGAEDFVFSHDANVFLRLNIDTLSPGFIGTPNSDLSFSVVRVEELWRGAAHKMSDDISFDTEGAEVGGFNINEIDSAGFVEFELLGTWKNDYIDFYTDSTDSRDSSYQYFDYGLALVPNDGTDKIVHARFASSRLYIFEPEQSLDTTIVSMLDWAYDMQVTGGNSPADNFTMSNTYEQYLKYNLKTIVDTLDNVNFVRAELALRADTLTMRNSLNSDQVRTEVPPFKAQLGPSVDLAYDIGFNTNSGFAVYNSGVYKFDLTDLFIGYLYGNTDLEEVYFYADQNNGRLGFTSFYGTNADPENSPKLLIYTLEEGE